MNNRAEKFKLYIDNKKMMTFVLLKTIPKKILNQSNYDDFLSAGKIQLILNLEKFDPEKAEFSSWAYKILQNAYLKHWNFLSERKINKDKVTRIEYKKLTDDMFIYIPSSEDVEGWVDYRIALYRFVRIILSFGDEKALQLFELLYLEKKHHELTVQLSRALAWERKKAFYEIWNNRRTHRSFIKNYKYVEKKKLEFLKGGIIC